MDFGGREPAESQMQIAPIIDIVFILLVFFIATYAAVEEERNLDVNLPEASSATERSRNLREVVVNLDSKGNITVNRRQLKPETLASRLRRLVEFSKSPDVQGEPGVIIRADGDCPHRYAVQIMDICARSNIKRVFFSTVAENN